MADVKDDDGSDKAAVIEPFRKRHEMEEKDDGTLRMKTSIKGIPLRKMLGKLTVPVTNNLSRSRGGCLSFSTGQLQQFDGADRLTKTMNCC